MGCGPASPSECLLCFCCTAPVRNASRHQGHRGPKRTRAHLLHSLGNCTCHLGNTNKWPGDSSGQLSLVYPLGADTSSPLLPSSRTPLDECSSPQWMVYQARLPPTPHLQLPGYSQALQNMSDGNQSTEGLRRGPSQHHLCSQTRLQKDGGGSSQKPASNLASQCD